MVTLTITLDPGSPQDVARAQVVLSQLDDPATAPGHEPAPAGSQAFFAAAAANLLDRTGPSLQELLKVSAELGVFTMATLADRLGRSPSSTRSLFANLGRSVNAMNDAVPGAPRLFSDEKRDDVWHFTMPEEYRNIILGNSPG
jgi:hypothetical protein